MITCKTWVERINIETCISSQDQCFVLTFALSKLTISCLSRKDEYLSLKLELINRGKFAFLNNNTFFIQNLTHHIFNHGVLPGLLISMEQKKKNQNLLVLSRKYLPWPLSIACHILALICPIHCQLKQMVGLHKELGQI